MSALPQLSEVVVDREPPTLLLVDWKLPWLLEVPVDWATPLEVLEEPPTLELWLLDCPTLDVVPLPPPTLADC